GIAEHTADVDQCPRGACPGSALEVLARDDRAVDDAPVVGVEQPTGVVEGHVEQLAIDRHSGVVDPGIEPAEAVAREAGDAAKRFEIGDVGGKLCRLATLALELADKILKLALRAAGEHHARALAHGMAGSGEADAAGGT